ncbi:VQ motif-containing protein 11-like [Canna indica]|uniref:VQ motif-containing protein 11-like n=1 Tax=Canna indica TaxID=4628 RepID=A0AAQ3K3K1_9LILI|nr:VQ motif-containing protein 11-like [Canna indica]
MDVSESGHSTVDPPPYSAPPPALPQDVPPDPDLVAGPWIKDSQIEEDSTTCLNLSSYSNGSIKHVEVRPNALHSSNSLLASDNSMLKDVVSTKPHNKHVNHSSKLDCKDLGVAIESIRLPKKPYEDKYVWEPKESGLFNDHPHAMASKSSVEGLSCSASVSGNTTYVHADPANFRAVVQRLTGAAAAPDEPPVPAKRQKLQERRRAATNLEINISRPPPPPSPLYCASIITSQYCYRRPQQISMSGDCFATGRSSWSKGDEVGLFPSPISTMDSFLLASSSSPIATATHAAAPEEEEEERAIAEKGFYLHPSPGKKEGKPPKLLSLFPLESPKKSSFE